METEAHSPALWAQNNLRFALHTPEPDLNRRAKCIMQYWNAPGSSPTEICNMYAASVGAAWRFQGSQADTSGLYTDIPTVLRAAETDAALAIINRPAQFLTVHGALLARGDDAVLLVGPSHSGKSTTSCALWAAGWQLLSDDLTILLPSPDTGMASPVLRRVSLRHGSKGLLGDEFWQRIIALETCDETPEGYVFHPDELEPAGRSRARTVRLCAIVFLRRREIPSPAPACLSRIAPIEALLALCPYTNVIRHMGLGECMARLGGLMNSVPCYDLGRGPLPAMIDAIQNLVRPEPAVEHGLFDK